MKTSLTALAAALAIGSLSIGAAATTMAQQATQAMTQSQIHGKLASGGYTKINDMKFKDGMWHADAKSADGNHVQVRVDPKTGKIYPNEEVSRLSKSEISAALETQGYTKVHDVDYDDGVWKAKAHNRAGNKVKLKVDAGSGKVIGED